MDLKKIAISSLSFLTLKEKICLSENLSDFDELLSLSIGDISKITGRSFKSAKFDSQRISSLVRLGAELMEKQNIKSVCFDEDFESYPALLRLIKDPPYMLFYRGNIQLLKKECVSVVGTRKACPESAKAAFEFARDAAKDNLAVVSGLACGIDSFAHRGALEGGNSCGIFASTAAVLPCGIDTITPNINKGLALEILRQKGCILSEYIPGTPAENFRFVQRNRIIAALSPSVVIVQAPPSSGALITAEFALDYNRDLVIHKSCLCENALLISKSAESKLALKHKKYINRVEKYLEEGAPLVNNYFEYTAAKKDAPGVHAFKGTLNKQLNLFS